MPRTLFTNVLIFDGTGKSSYPGEVLLQGNRIKAVVEGTDQIDQSLAEEVVDEPLHDLPEGLDTSPIRLQSHDAVIEKEDGILIRVVRGLHGELVDRIGLHGGITLLGDLWRLRGKRGGGEQE